MRRMFKAALWASLAIVGPAAGLAGCAATVEPAPVVYRPYYYDPYYYGPGYSSVVVVRGGYYGGYYGGYRRWR